MNIEEEIKQIKERNERVELDKKWEGSIIRKILICILTYIIVVLYSYFINNNGLILLNSFVPVVGFFLSTLSLDYIKKTWINIKLKGRKQDETR